MSLYRTAQTIYAALADDEKSMAAIRDERKSLALSIATDPNGATQVTSATVNGQTFTAMQGMKAGERLRVLSLVCAMSDVGTPVSAQATASF